MSRSTHRTQDEDKRKRSFYYFLFTFLFCLTAFLCFIWFIITGKSFICEGDGWEQHFKALVYYGRYLRGIIRHLLFDHRLIIPEWDFYIGEGSDILNALHYYVIGDPLTVPAVFVPTRYMHWFYSFSCIFRIYLAGIAFSKLCFGTGLKNRYGIMAGAIGYCFSEWSLINAARHPYFLNPLIYFPLMILGIEKILRKEKPYLFIIIAALSAVSNFYFFYIIAILAVLYAVIRLFFLRGRTIRERFLSLVYMGIMAFIGLFIAGIVLLPVMMMFLHDSRISVSQTFFPFYPMSYYCMLPSIVISGNTQYWLRMGYTVPSVLAVFLLFIKRKKEDRFLRILVLVGIGIILIPICGRVLNGMSYMSNRWVWAFTLLCMYILAAKWEEMHALSGKEWRRLLMCSLFYYLACIILEKSRTPATLSAIPAFFIALMIMREGCAEREDFGEESDMREYSGGKGSPEESSGEKSDPGKRTGEKRGLRESFGGIRPTGRKRKYMQTLMVVLVMVSAVNLAFWRYAPSEGGELLKCKNNRDIRKEWKNTELPTVKKVADPGYTRITGGYLTYNANIFSEISSTQYYWSISNPNVNLYRTDLWMLENMYSRFRGYDERTVPLTLSAVQYYSSGYGEGQGMPYGYTLVWPKEGSPESAAPGVYHIYKNEYALPVGYCYDTCYAGDRWESLDPVQRQEAQLDGAFVEEKIDGIMASGPAATDYTCAFEIECRGNGVTKTESGFVTTAGNIKVVLTLPDEGAETEEETGAETGTEADTETGTEADTETETDTKTGGETYVGFEGLTFSPTSKYDLYFGDAAVDPQGLFDEKKWAALPGEEKLDLRKDHFYRNPVQDVDITAKSSNGFEKTLSYRQPESAFSSGRHDYIINLGYSEEPVTQITLTLRGRGVYSYDALRVYRVPMDAYSEKISKLKENVLENVQLGVNTLSGDISTEKEKLLCVAIPFSEGWRASVDGQEVKVYCLNKRYLGLLIPSGNHRVVFRYHTPYKMIGLCVSGFGLCAFALVILLGEKKEKRHSGGTKRLRARKAAQRA